MKEFTVRECVGCGFCCLQARCSLSVRIWPNGDGECQALIWDGSRYKCKLALMSGQRGAEYRAALYIGDGCCSSLNSWRLEVKPRRPKDEDQIKKYKLDPAFAAFLRSLGRGFMSGDSMFLAVRGMQFQLEVDGVDEEEIASIVKEIAYIFRENRPGYMNGFMGEVPEMDTERN